MQKNIGWLSVVGFFGLLAAANAQSPPPAVIGSSYDGTYRLVSSANVNATYTSRKGQTASCPGRRAGPLRSASLPSASGAAPRGTPDRPKGFGRFLNFLRGSWAELQRVQCPTRSQVAQDADRRRRTRRRHTQTSQSAQR